MNTVNTSTHQTQALAVSAISKSGTQSRKNLDTNTVREIRDDIKDGNHISPIVVFFDGQEHWIGDGYHRLEAHLKEKREVISADVRSGSKEDALRFNISSNASADQTRWTNADKRNAVTMLLQAYGESEVTRARAQEIAALAKCTSALVYKISGELNDLAQPLSKTSTPSQPTVAQAVTKSTVPEAKPVVQQEQVAKVEPKRNAPAGRRSVEMVDRDTQVAALAADGLSQADIARRLKVSAGTVSDSFRRQKLTPETANPLVKVLERAQLTATEWESMSSLLVSGVGAAAGWMSATREQKKEVIGHVKEAIRFQNEFINRLNKEAKDK